LESNVIDNQTANGTSNGVSHGRAPAPLADQAILDGLSRALMGDKQDVKKLTATTRVINAFHNYLGTVCGRPSDETTPQDTMRLGMILKILEELEPQDRLRRLS
jgi:hypothetical protein